MASPPPALTVAVLVGPRRGLQVQETLQVAGAARAVWGLLRAFRAGVACG